MTTTLLEMWLREIGVAGRQLRRSPLFSLGTIGVLALGIGASSALLSVAYTVLVSPLPLPESDVLVRLTMARPGATTSTWSEAEFLTVAARARTLESVAAYDPDVGVALLSPSGPVQVHAGTASASLLRTLGVTPTLGRFFSADEDLPGAPRAVALSQALWRDAFGADQEIEGRTLVLDGVPYSVVGVVPDALRSVFPGIELWRPLRLDRVTPNVDSGQYLRTIARVMTDVDPPAVQRELDQIGQALTDERLTRYEGSRVSVTPLSDDLTSHVRAELWGLSFAVLIVLLTACFNLAGFMITRSLVRRDELAVRRALGATRGDLLRASLTEVGILATLGIGIGALLAAVGVEAAARLGPAVVPRSSELALEPRALTLAASAAVITLVAFGVVKSVRISGNRLPSLRGRTSRIGASMRSAVVVGQLATCTALLVGAGVLVRSIIELQRVTLGFETEEVTTFKLGLPAVRYPDAASIRAFTAEMLADVRGVPGIRSAAATSRPPLADGSSIGFAWTTPTSLEGVLPTEVAMRWATDGYFETMGIELVEGRPIRAEDGSDTTRVSVISRSLAEALWPGRSAIGRSWKLGRLVGPATAWRTVVGVVEDIRDAGPDSGMPAMAYFPQSQLGLGREMHVVVASSIPQTPLVATIRGVIARVDPTLPMYDVRSMTRLLERRTALNRIGGEMLVLFAALALLLATVGVYGLTGLLLAERTREFGVRAAVGASRDRLIGMVVRDGAELAAQGVALGLIAGIGLTRVLQSLVVGVPLIDVPTLLSASAVMALVSLMASLMPARALVPDDPARVLRD